MIPRDRIGVSELRAFNAERLRELKEPLLIQRDSERLAVLVPYDLFIEWQWFLEAPLPAIRSD